MLIDKNNSHFLKDIFVLAFLFTGSFFIGQLLSAGILYAAYGMEVLNIEKIVIDTTESLNAIRVSQVVASLITFGMPVWIFGIHKTKKSYNCSSQTQSVKWILWLIIPLLVITIYPFLNLMYVLNEKSFLGKLMLEQQEQYAMFVEALLRPTSFLLFLFNLVVIAVLPAILEEFFFRGTLQRIFMEKLNVHLAILLTAFIFSFIHFEFSAFLPRIILGILLGYIFYLSGNIWLAVFTHLFNNGMEVTLMYLKNLHLISGTLSDAPEMPSLSKLVSYSILFIILSIFFYRSSKR